MKKGIFQKKYSSKYPKARSLISGNINAKEPDPEVIKDMDFVIYEVILGKTLSISQQFDLIKSIGFDCVEYKIS